MTRHRLGTVSNQHARSFPLLLALCRPASPKRLQMVLKSHVVHRCLLWLPHAACTLPTNDRCLLWFQVSTGSGTPATYPPVLPTYPPTYLPTYQATSQPTQTTNAPTHPPTRPTNQPNIRLEQIREGKGRHGNKEPDKRRQGKTRETVH